MGLTNKSVGKAALQKVLLNCSGEKVIALTGNPNVGKSTLFNSLTGMKQHTGNWPGKTVEVAQGVCKTKTEKYVFVDLPGTYSLLSHSAEEEIARNFLCFNSPFATVVVCDASCLERNLNLVLQVMEICKNVVVCVNLLDQAKSKKITVDLNLLQKRLGVKVVGTVARNRGSLKRLLETINSLPQQNLKPLEVRYETVVEQAIKIVQNELLNKNLKGLNSRWLALKLLDKNQSLNLDISKYLGLNFIACTALQNSIKKAEQLLLKNGITNEILKEIIVTKQNFVAENVCKGAVVYNAKRYSGFDRTADKILTGKLTGFPVMILLLLAVFWFTVIGSEYLSSGLFKILFWFQNILKSMLVSFNTPSVICSALCDGVYKVLAWVVAVMLPPMAIFFPLFTLLEDSGYLPRIAYNLDKPFKKCNACGKQSLTMCMGFGCNAAGVVGCRIIDSERERLLAVLTNSFVPCNGRFPTLILLITMFFIGTEESFLANFGCAAILTLLILLGVAATFSATFLLSKTVLKGKASAFTLELPSYRKPQIAGVIVRSLFDRTAFVLGRAVAVAAPTGLLIWLLSNITVNGKALLITVAAFLNPFAKLFGLDGIILTAFVLGLPANEIVVPIIIMAYLGKTSILELGSAVQLKQLFLQNGWNTVTAVCTMVFMLFHWPCSTTLLTVKKETGSLKWAVVSALLPVSLGVILCFFINLIFN